MNFRWLKYHCCFAWREYVVEGPAIVFERLALRYSNQSDIHGIKVTDPTPETRKYFDSIIRSALDLIATVDPVFFARARRELRYIVNGRAAQGYRYGRTSKLCALDIRCYYVENDLPMTNHLVAAAIVEAATTGRLHGSGILRYDLNCERYDALRREKAQRFLRRCGITPDESECQYSGGSVQRSFASQAIKIIFEAATRNPAEEAALWEELCNAPKESRRND